MAPHLKLLIIEIYSAYPDIKLKIFCHLRGKNIYVNDAPQNGIVLPLYSIFGAYQCFYFVMT